MSDSVIPSFLVNDVSKSLRSLTKNELCEQIAQVAHQKWATMSKSLRSLTKNERIVHFFERIAHLLIFLQKKSDSLRKPMSKFPALKFSNSVYQQHQPEILFRTLPFSNIYIYTIQRKLKKSKLFIRWNK